MPDLDVHRRLFPALLGLALFLGPSAAAGPLTDAVDTNDLALVHKLLADGADVNETGRKGMPIHIAAEQGATEIIAALIAAGADIEAEGRAGAHPLHLAAAKNHTAAVTLLLDQGAQVEATDNFGFTPLMAALASPPEGFDTAVLLLAAGADPDARDKADGMTSLHWAAGRGRLEVARFLILKGADINARSGTETTPLHDAVWRRRLEMIGFLVGNGADINAADRNGETPVDFARGNAEVIGLLRAP